MFARIASELVAWITFLALWVWGATYFFCLLLDLPQEVGAYIFGFVPLMLACYIHIKHWKPIYEFQLYFIEIASGAAVAGAAIHFFGHSHSWIHVPLGAIGWLSIMPGTWSIMVDFRDYGPGRNLGLFPTCLFGCLGAYSLFDREKAQVAIVAGIFFVSATVTLTLEFWPTIRLWVRKVHATLTSLRAHIV